MLDEELRFDLDSLGYVYIYDNELYFELVIVEKCCLIFFVCCSGDI